MKVFVVGLGLMGASYAMGLTEKGYHVFGYDHQEKILHQAIQCGIIDKESSLTKLSQVDLIILALYPHDNILFVKKYKHLLTKHQCITDISGTKLEVVSEIEKCLDDNISYTSHHPMAGKESKGFESRDVSMFKGANFIIVPTEKSKESDIIILKKLANDLGFKHTITVSKEMHDELIAFTSQLTHVLAVSLVNSDAFEQTKFATGDSYRDLTRIAKINEVLWSELFIENKDALIKQMDTFIKEINDMKIMILDEDQEGLKKALRKAKEKRESFDVY